VENKTKLIKNLTPNKALKCSISIILPSVILFSVNQIVVSWNLNKLITKIESTESNLSQYQVEYSKDKPAPGAENEYWAQHGNEIDYVGPKDIWARNSILPTTTKYIPKLNKDIAEMQSLNLITFDQSIKIAKDSYLEHANVWLSLLEKTQACGSRPTDSYLYSCIDDLYYYGGSDDITRSWDNTRLEIKRISPMFNLFNLDSRISKIVK
jgi:hypothetical protein